MTVYMLQRKSARKRMGNPLMRKGDAPAVWIQHWKPSRFPEEALLSNPCWKAIRSWSQMAAEARAAIHALRKKGLAATCTWPSSDFPSGPPGQGQCQAHPSSTPKALSYTPTLSGNSLTDGDKFHLISASLNPVPLMPGPTITEEGCPWEGCWDFCCCLSHFCFLAAVRWSASFTICSYHDELLCHRPKSDEAKWRQGETSNTRRHQLSSGSLCPSDRNLTTDILYPAW